MSKKGEQYSVSRSEKIGIGYRDEQGAPLMEGDEVEIRDAQGRRKGRIEYTIDLGRYDIHVTHKGVGRNFWVLYCGPVDLYIPPECYLPRRRRWWWPWQTSNMLQGILLRRRKVSFTELNDNMPV